MYFFTYLLWKKNIQIVKFNLNENVSVLKSRISNFNRNIFFISSYIYISNYKHFLKKLNIIVVRFYF